MPGPGMYNPQLKEGQGFKFDKTERKLDINDNPGPGHYKVKCTFADVPQYAMPNQTENFKYV